MANATSFAPDEPFADILAERGAFIGICLGFGAWGILFTLAFQCAKMLSENLTRWGTRILLVYVLLVFSLATIVVSTHLKWYQTFLIDNRNYPGGPIAFDHAFYAVDGPNIAGDVCAFAINWLADALLLYRLFVIWEHKLLVVVIPFLMVLTNFSLSVVELVIVSRPGSSEFVPKAINFGLLYWSFSLACNVVITLLIVLRLLIHRRRVTALIGRHHGRVYFSTSAMLIESAALYSCVGIIWIIGDALQDSLQWSIEAFIMFEGIAALLIIHRVANGKAYTEQTLSTSMRSSNPSKRTDSSKESGTQIVFAHDIVSTELPTTTYKTSDYTSTTSSQLEMGTFDPRTTVRTQEGEKAAV